MGKEKLDELLTQQLLVNVVLFLSRMASRILWNCLFHGLSVSRSNPDHTSIPLKFEATRSGWLAVAIVLIPLIPTLVPLSDFRSDSNVCSPVDMASGSWPCFVAKMENVLSQCQNCLCVVYLFAGQRCTTFPSSHSGLATPSAYQQP